ncbi:aspartate--tRNA(Asn) ligase [Candidatus Saccharibacteria bacterium]|nr:aspartate--tRNA(Asn) ligase [Candidatus Saccharibacteria bacterium]
MTNRIMISDLSQHIGKTVTIAGWFHKRRLMGGINFLVVRDRTGLVQIVDDTGEEAAKLDGLYAGTVVELEGEVRADERAMGGVELHAPKLTVKTPVATVPAIEFDKPIDHRPENLDTLFEHRVLALRNPTEAMIFTLQDRIDRLMREYFQEKSCTQIHTPKILAEATEGGAEVFTFDYFDATATLAQSPQFYKQMMVGTFERVYEIGPVYRAEPSTTTRHMSEYISVDAELGFLNDFSELLTFIGGLLHHVVARLWEQNAAELAKLQAKPVKLADTIPAMTLEELHEAYFKATKEDLRHEKDPTPAEERFASEYALKKWGSEAVFITEFPASEMKFYHLKKADNPLVCDRADLIFRGVEIATISMRENRYDVLVEQMKAAGLDPASPGYKYYLDAFRAGLPLHGGFGLGLERLTAKIIGLNNVKEATLFPRDMQRLAP